MHANFLRAYKVKRLTNKQCNFDSNSPENFDVYLFLLKCFQTQNNAASSIIKFKSTFIIR